MPRVRPHEGRRAGTAVQILVAAADGEIGAVGVQVHRHRAGAVRQVPHRQRAGVGGHARQRRHVVHAAAAVIHVREHEHGAVLVQRRGQFVGLDEHEFMPALARQRLGDIQVGGEVAALGDDALAFRGVGLRHRQCRAQHLEQIDTGRVGHHQFARAGAHQPRDLVAHALRQLHPAGRVPALDEVHAPFLLHHLLHARGGGFWQHAERIAVEVDQARRQAELFAQRRQRIGGVQRQGFVSGHGSSLSTARTGEASAVVSFRGRAISS